MYYKTSVVMRYMIGTSYTFPTILIEQPELVHWERRWISNFKGSLVSRASLARTVRAIQRNLVSNTKYKKKKKVIYISYVCVRLCAPMLVLVLRHMWRHSMMWDVLNPFLSYCLRQGLIESRAHRCG